MDNVRRIWDSLISAGLTPAGAAGLMGNLKAESGLRPDNLQNTCEAKLGFTDEGYTVAVDNGTYTNFVHDRAGYGIAQWTHPIRKMGLLDCAQRQHRSVADLDVQMEYLLLELQSMFSAVWDKLQATDNVQEASDCVLLDFERPASVNDPKKLQETKALRAGYAQEFYDQFSKTGGNSLKLYKCLLTENECYKTGVKIKPVGVMVHSTGANNPNLRRYVQPVASTPGRADLLAALGTNPNGNSWNQFRPGGTQVCVHAFIGKLADGSVAAVQTLPWDIRGWHSGYADRNAATNANKLGYIGFEICEDGLTDPVYFAQVYRTAVELTAMLCKQYEINPKANDAVICHQEGYRRGIASNHGDVLHWFPKHGKTMNDFRADVAAKLKEEDDDMVIYKTLADVPNWYKSAVQKAVDKGALNGTGGGEINVSEDLCRTLTVLDRLGKLDN